MIIEHIFIRQIPVVRYIAAIIIAHRQSAILISLIEGVDKAIQLAIVILHQEGVQAMVRVIEIDQTITNVIRRDTIFISSISGIYWHTHASRNPFSAWISTKIIIKGVV